MEIPPQAVQAQGFAMQGAGAVDTEKMSPEAKRRIYYGLVFFIVITLSGAVGYFINNDPVTLYISLCVSFALVGILHLYLTDWLRLFSNTPRFAPRLLFHILIVLLSMLGFAGVFYFLSHHSGHSLFFALSVLYLLAPMAVMRCFDLALAVPPRDYKQWYYPSKPIVADMDRVDLSNFAIITYVFSKKYGDIEKSNFQSKAPYDIKLGDLFYFFIQEWNYKYPQANIQYIDEDKETFGWLFYVKDKWYQSRCFLDPDKTIRDNQIKVNQIIQTLRVPQSNPQKTA